MIVENTTPPEEVIKKFNSDTASITKIAEHLFSKHHASLDDRTLELMSRLCNGDFDFILPDGIPDNFKTKSLTIGNNEITCSYIQKVISEVGNRMREAIKRKHEFQLDYEALLSPVLTGNLREQIIKIKESIIPPEKLPIQARKHRQIRWHELSNNQIDTLLHPHDKALKLALANLIYVPKEMFHKWVRINGIEDSILYDKFWSDEFEGYPIIWHSHYDNTNGLSLNDAFKYCSDPHLWEIYRLKTEELRLLFDRIEDEAHIKSDYNRKKAEILILESKLLKYFLRHFRDNKLQVTGYSKKGESKKPINIENDYFYRCLEDQEFYGYKLYKETEERLEYTGIKIYNFEENTKALKNKANKAMRKHLKAFEAKHKDDVSQPTKTSYLKTFSAETGYAENLLNINSLSRIWPWKKAGRPKKESKQ